MEQPKPLKSLYFVSDSESSDSTLILEETRPVDPLVAVPETSDEDEGYKSKSDIFHSITYQKPVRLVQKKVRTNKTTIPKTINTPQAAALTIQRCAKALKRARNYIDTYATKRARQNAKFVKGMHHTDNIVPQRRDFVKRYCSDLEMGVWGTNGVVGELLSDTYEPPKTEWSKHVAMAADSQIKWTREYTRDWMDTAGPYWKCFRPFRCSRADLMIQMVVVAQGKMDQATWHKAVETLDCLTYGSYPEQTYFERHVPDSLKGDNEKLKHMDMYSMRVLASSIAYNLLPIEDRPTIEYLVECVRNFSFPIDQIDDHSHEVFLMQYFLESRADAVRTDEFLPPHRRRAQKAEQERRDDLHQIPMHCQTEADLEKCITQTKDLCIMTSRQPTVYSIGLEICRLITSMDCPDTAQVFNVLAIVAALRGHKAESLQGQNQLNRSAHFLFPSKKMMAAALVCNARLRRDPDCFWHGSCVEACGVTEQLLQPLASRMFDVTCIPPHTSDKQWIQTFMISFRSLDVDAGAFWKYVTPTWKDMNNTPHYLNRHEYSDPEYVPPDFFVERYDPHHDSNYPQPPSASEPDYSST